MKFKCAFALFVDDAKNNVILSSTMFTKAKYKMLLK